MKCPGRPDLQAHLLGHDLVDDRQRDRQPALGLENLRQVAIGGVVVVVVVAGEAELVEQVPVQVG
jgi:hypothetical protein